MISILLTILKVLGILILSLLGIVILVLLLVLFIPVRYRIYAERKLESGMPVLAKIKATWLLHLLNVHFSYPEKAYVRVRIGCFTVFRSDRTGKKPKEKTKEKSKEKETISEEESFEIKSGEEQEAKEDKVLKEDSTIKEAAREDQTEKESKKDQGREKKEAEKPTIKNFFKKILALLKNLQYTITQICDKIKKIVKNIKYYIEVIGSTEFKNAFRLCSSQAGALLRHICPKKIKGNLQIGTGDPASTGQVIAIYGMLYPFLGNQ
ncbi:MAG: DUF2953 domain-containing protein, partial [Lachnospiraceae bacterium]|nr:DUF2953 domain-containing protein [Lachnospiraceae bacterium]